MDATLAFLDVAGGSVSRIALALLIMVNGGFALAVFLRRDRRLVNRWTHRLVALDAALLLAAGGAPVAAWTVRTAVRAVALVIPELPRSTAAADGPAEVVPAHLGP